MASLIDRKAEISALKAKLLALSQSIEDTELSPDKAKQDPVECLRSQMERLDAVERQLLQATESILSLQGSSSRQALTVTEFVQAAQTVHCKQQQQIQLNAVNPTEQGNDHQSDKSYRSKTHRPRWNGTTTTTLDPVIETEHETADGILRDTVKSQTSQLTNSLQLQDNSSTLPNHADTTITGHNKNHRNSTQRMEEALAQLEHKLKNEVHRSQLHTDDASSSQSSLSSNDENNSFGTQSMATGPTWIAQNPIVSGRENTSSHTKDDSLSDEDDSAWYCATVLANERNTLPEDLVHKEQPDITHIAIRYDPAIPSPAQTNITMDFTTFACDDQLATVLEDADSVNTEETPVLDRYRLDTDDNSPFGFRVVPNERGRRDQQKSNHEPPLVSNNNHLSGQSTRSRPRQIFRKTPYAKKVPSTPTIDENTPLNITELSSMLLSPISQWSPTTHHTRSPLEHVSEPTTRRSLDFSTSESIPNQPVTTALAPSLLYAQTKLASSLQQEASVSFKPPLRKNSKSLGCTPQQRQPGIQHVSRVEYENAPRVVQMQVSHDDVIRAVDALNQAFGPDGPVPLKLTETDALEVLLPLGYDERKSKSILLSLCHWKRLVMRRSSDDNNAPVPIFDILCI